MESEIVQQLKEIRKEKAELDPFRPQFCKTKTDWTKLDRWWELTKEENSLENKLYDINIDKGTPLSSPMSDE